MKDGYVTVFTISGERGEFTLRLHYLLIAILSGIFGVWIGYALWHQ